MAKYLNSETKVPCLVPLARVWVPLAWVKDGGAEDAAVPDPTCGVHCAPSTVSHAGVRIIADAEIKTRGNPDVQCQGTRAFVYSVVRSVARCVTEEYTRSIGLEACAGNTVLMPQSYNDVTTYSLEAHSRDRNSSARQKSPRKAPRMNK